MYKQKLKNIIKSIIFSLPIKITKNQKYDKQSIKVMKKALDTTSNCIDIGCHKGEVLTYMLKYSPRGTHFGFEPIPSFYQYLVSTFPSNCEIYQLAISDSKGETSFNYVETNPAYSGIKRRKYDKKNEEVSLINVQMDLLDNIIPHDIKIDLIKIDVEGAEMHVLKGALETIKKNKPIIIFEHGLGAADCYGTKPQDIYQLLNEECGLKISLMKYWLKGNKILSKEEFIEQFEKNTNYYFIAFHE